MVSRDVAALFMEHMPDDEIRSLRDSIAKAEAELTASMWERHRELHGRIEELKGKCEEAARFWPRSPRDTRRGFSLRLSSPSKKETRSELPVRVARSIPSLRSRISGTDLFRR